MNILAISGFLTGITCFSLAVFIYRCRANKVHTSFAIQNLAIGTWGFGNGFAAISKTAEMAAFWWNIALMGGFIIIPMLLHHTLLRLKRISEKKQKVILAISYMWAFIFPLMCVFNLTGIKVTYKFSSWYFPQPANPLYISYYMAWLLGAGYVTFLTIQGFLKSSKEEKVPLGLYTLAYVSGIWGGGTYVFLTVFDINILYPWGNFLIVSYTLIITYAIFDTSC